MTEGKNTIHNMDHWRPAAKCDIPNDCQHPYCKCQREDQKPAQPTTTDDQPQDELIYSGRIEAHDVRDPGWNTDDDLLHVRVVRQGAAELLHIETVRGPVRALIKLDKRQANALHRCMRNAVARWDRREP